MLVHRLIRARSIHPVVRPVAGRLNDIVSSAPCEFFSSSFFIRHNSTQPPSSSQVKSRPDWAEPSRDHPVASRLTCQSDTETRALHPTQDKKKPFYAPYLALTKPKLTALVVISAMCPYALAPHTATLSQLMFLTVGTALASGSANAINMAREHRYDALMARTKTRPVVRGAVSGKQAFQFASLSGSVGVAALYFGVNPTVAVLGAANIAIYGGLYTTLKRKHIINTWAGAVVGAIPPLMGWAASSSLADPGAWLLAALLYAWQFPHFMSLSHNIRDEYRRAGYVMACWKNPALNARVALKYSVAMFPICIGLSYFGICDPFFALDSAILNGWMTWGAYKFWQEYRYVTKPVFEAGATANARKLFWASVWHLPGVLVLALLHKSGQWDWLFGNNNDDDDEDTFE